MNITNFLLNAAQDGQAWDVAALSALAAARGLAFSADDLQTAADELWGGLSEDALRGVAAGGGNGRQDPGPVRPDTSKAGNPNGQWSPPPGDVSGNSCFFWRPR